MPHKLLLAGSRYVDEDACGQHLMHEIKCAFGHTPAMEDLVIISGMARGMDTVAVRIAGYFSLDLIKMPADWNKHGKAAGMIRNAEMVNLADEVWVWWDGKSRGTENTIQHALEKGKTLRVYFV